MATLARLATNSVNATVTAAATASVSGTPARREIGGVTSSPIGSPASDACQSHAETRETASRGTFRWKKLNQVAPKKPPLAPATMAAATSTGSGSGFANASSGKAYRA